MVVTCCTGRRKLIFVARYMYVKVLAPLPKIKYLLIIYVREYENIFICFMMLFIHAIRLLSAFVFFFAAR